jgi:hypothetical protein
MSWLFASHEKKISPTQQLQAELCKIDRPLPERAAHLSVLKTIEKELRLRGFLGNGVEQAMPLWFLAETERNVFLWRKGLSIDDAHEFEFWVDVPSLIEKRRKHLERCDGFNPFINESPAETGAEQELRYLDIIEELGESVIDNAAVISRASQALQHELDPGAAQRAIVVLPYRGG